MIFNQCHDLIISVEVGAIQATALKPYVLCVTQMLFYVSQIPSIIMKIEKKNRLYNLFCYLVVLVGFGMFGGRGEYTCKLKLFDLGMDGGGYEKDGNLLAETDEIPYECAARSKYNIMLPKPLFANAGRWYLVWARIAGPSSDCGSSGQSSVTTEDQIVFNFKTSKKANNGTDVNSGQIPSILYR